MYSFEQRLTRDNQTLRRTKRKKLTGVRQNASCACTDDEWRPDLAPQQQHADRSERSVERAFPEKPPWCQ